MRTRTVYYGDFLFLWLIRIGHCWTGQWRRGVKTKWFNFWGFRGQSWTFYETFYLDMEIYTRMLEFWNSFEVRVEIPMVDTSWPNPAGGYARLSLLRSRSIRLPGLANIQKIFSLNSASVERIKRFERRVERREPVFDVFFSLSLSFTFIFSLFLFSMTKGNMRFVCQNMLFILGRPAAWMTPGVVVGPHRQDEDPPVESRLAENTEVS